MEKHESIQILQDIIQIASENGNEKEVALYYQKLLESHGITSHLVDYSQGRSSLVAEIHNGEGPVLVLSGHMDVVSAGNPKDWIHPPFSGYIDENNVIWGRGTSDMKSGLTALVIAFIHLFESKTFNGRLKLIATVGEEVGELGSAQLTDLGFMDNVDGLLIGEPCNIGVVYAHKGSLNYKVTSKGLAAHSSTPELGNNAIEHLTQAMSQITDKLAQKAKSIVNPVLGQTFHNITVTTGGSQVNSIPDFAEFEANARTIPEFNNNDVMRVVQSVIDDLNLKQGYHLEAKITADQPPVQTNPHSELIQTIITVANECEKLKPQFLINQMNSILATDEKLNPQDFKEMTSIKPIVVSGTTDAAQFLRANNQIDLAVYGPGMPMLNHKLNERLPISQYLDFIEVYKGIIRTYMQVKQS